MFFGDIAFSIATESTERDTPDGVLTVTTASRVLPAQETGRWRNAEEELGSIAATLYARGHVIRGVTNVEGEENSDMWRMCVRGGRVVRQDVILSWPDLPPEDAPVEDPASGPGHRPVGDEDVRSSGLRVGRVLHGGRVVRGGVRRPDVLRRGGRLPGSCGLPGPSDRREGGPITPDGLAVHALEDLPEPAVPGVV
jgi:hypothetical protein